MKKILSLLVAILSIAILYGQTSLGGAGITFTDGIPAFTPAAYSKYGSHISIDTTSHYIYRWDGAAWEQVPEFSIGGDALYVSQAYGNNDHAQPGHPGFAWAEPWTARDYAVSNGKTKIIILDGHFKADTGTCPSCDWVTSAQDNMSFMRDGLNYYAMAGVSFTKETGGNYNVGFFSDTTGVATTFLGEADFIMKEYILVYLTDTQSSLRLEGNKLTSTILNKYNMAICTHCTGQADDGSPLLVDIYFRDYEDQQMGRYFSFWGNTSTSFESPRVRLRTDRMTFTKEGANVGAYTYFDLTDINDGYIKIDIGEVLYTSTTADSAFFFGFHRANLTDTEIDVSIGSFRSEGIKVGLLKGDGTNTSIDSSTTTLNIGSIYGNVQLWNYQQDWPATTENVLINVNIDQMYHTGDYPFFNLGGEMGQAGVKFNIDANITARDTSIFYLGSTSLTMDVTGRFVTEHEYAPVIRYYGGSSSTGEINLYSMFMKANNCPVITADNTLNVNGAGCFYTPSDALTNVTATRLSELPAATGDNLGNHEATQNLDMSVYSINLNGDASEGLNFVNSNGSARFRETGTTAALTIDDEHPTTTNARIESVTIRAYSAGGSMNDGFGPAIYFNQGDLAAQDNDAAIIASYRDGADNKGGLHFYTVNIGTALERLEISASGVIKFNNAYTFPTSDGNTNEVLRTNGSGALSFSADGAAIGSSVYSGTAGSVLFVDASTQIGQDNTNLYWDDSNNRLGIGNNTPSHVLDVVGDFEFQPEAGYVFDWQNGTDESPFKGIMLSADNGAIDTSNPVEPVSGSVIMLNNDDATVDDRDQLGVIAFMGDDPNSTDMTTTAMIRAHANGNWSASSTASILEFWVTNNNTVQQLQAGIIKSTGQWAMPQHGDGNFTGTATYLAAWDTNGNMIEENPVYKTYGYMGFQQSTTTVTCTETATYYDITDGTNTLFSGEIDEGDVTVQGDSIIINATGDYSFNVSMCWSGGAATTHYMKLATYAAGVQTVVTASGLERDMVNTATGCASFQYVGNFTSGAVIKPVVRRFSGTNDPTFETGSMIVERKN